MAEYNWVDFIIVIFFLMSILAGMMRGLIKEVISLITWIVGLIVASMFAPRLAAAFTNNNAMQSVIVSISTAIGIDASHPISMISLGISFFCIFAVVLIIGSIINFFLSQAAIVPGIGIINRLFGGVFGFIRGYLLIVILVFLVQLTPFQEDSAWTQSKFVPVFQPAAAKLSDYIQPGLASLRAKAEGSLQQLGSIFGKTS